MANNRICLTCSKTYEYCGSCPSSLNLPVWKNLFDTENCKIIFETASDYAQKVITKELAKEKLSKCDLSCTNNLKEQIKELVTEIVMEEKVEPIIEETVDPTIAIKRKKKISVGNKNDD